MSNIVLVIPPADIYLSPLLGIGILYAMAKEAGHNVEVIDLNIDLYNSAEINQLTWRRGLNFYWNIPEVCNFIWDSSIEALLENGVKQLPFENIDVVGIRLAADSRFMAYKIAGWFKEHYSDALRVAGGPDTWFEKPNRPLLFDKELIGYAEGDFAKLIGLDNYHVKPDFSFAEKYQYLRHNIMPSETCRGCIHKCTFCKERQFGRFSVYPYKTVIQNLSNIKHSGHREVYFVDSLLNHTTTHLKNVLKIVRKMELTCSYNITPINLDEHCISLMGEVSNKIFLGIETFSEDFAQHLGKPGSRKAVAKNLNLLRKHGVSIETGIIIAGYPFQNRWEFDKDVETIISYKDVLSKIVISPLRIYKGTALRKGWLKYPTAIGWWKDNPEEFQIRLEWLVEMTERLEHAGVSLEVPLSEVRSWIKGMLMEPRG